MIRPARKKDLNIILEVTRACATHMIEQGIFQWNEHYPSLEAFQKDLDRKELFVYEKDARVLGAIVISTYMDAVYKPIEWIRPTERNIYIHRLCIHPREQGNGYANTLMDFAEAKAKKEGFQSIRLDTFSLNKKNVSFYSKRGYAQLGDIYFPIKSKAPFHCFELPLS